MYLVVTKSAPTIKIEPKKGGGAKIKLPRVTRKSSTEKGDGTYIILYITFYL
jgi:hypothetical protein